MDHRNVLVFSHEQDVDGVLSAAIMKIAFEEAEIVFTNYGLENMLSLSRKITDFIQLKPVGTIVIADIGPNVESYQPVLTALDASNKAGWRSIWIDHHVWPDGLVEEISRVCETVLSLQSNGGTKKCTAELCFEKFIPTNRLAADLAKIAHRTDFPDSDKFPIPPLTALISYYVGFHELHQKLHTVILENVAKGILWNTVMQDDVIEASRLIDSSIQHSVAATLVKEVHSANGALLVAITKSEPFVSRSMLLGRIMDENNIDLAFAYTDDGKLSIRRKEDGPSRSNNLDCSAIARLFREGGGHGGAAGGFLAVRPDQSNDGDAKAINEIVNAVELYLTQIV